MPHTTIPRPPKVSALALALSLAFASPVASADERADLEQLRATTMSLIEALVESGVMPREKADKLLREAEQKARARLAAAPPAAAPAPETGKDGKKVVRVPFVPESMKREIREQVKAEVLAQAREERWGTPGALPEWLDRIQFEGDLRLRVDSYALDRNNTAPGALNYLSADQNYTRGADLTGANGAPFNNSVSNTNTVEDFSRLRLRARLGANATLSDMVSAGISIATGNTTGPTSTNQTLGQGFNKYTLVLDRAHITVHPLPWLTLSGGRMANPFVGTDLLWADDLGFEGATVKLSKHYSADTEGFITAGWFPLRADSPLQTGSRHLAALQAGVTWKSARGSELKVAAGVFQYSGISGERENETRYGAGASATDYGFKYEYPASMRQRGNTLFWTNAASDPQNVGAAPTYWGLASEFREFNLNASLDIANFDPVRVVLTGDYVKNLGFDRNRIRQRTGAQLLDGRDTGYLGRILVGQTAMRQPGDWNVSLTYRWLGSDAVLDAFTNSDFGLGGTNNKGFIVGANYGIDKNAWLTLRWMSSSPIDSLAPKTPGGTAAPTRLSVDLLQVDLNTRF
jgi:hypothetical protein